MSIKYEQPVLKKYVIDCIHHLSERYQKNESWFECEADLHSDLYVLLNISEMDFWNSGSVIMGTEPNFKGNDLQIYAPNSDNKKDSVTIEIKFWRSEESIETDLKRLNQVKEGTRILLYIGYEDEEGYSKVIDKLSKFHKNFEYNPIIMIYLHSKKKMQVIGDN